MIVEHWGILFMCKGIFRTGLTMFQQKCSFLILVLFLASQHATGKSAGDSIEPKALVFGGNSFLGSDVVEHLVKAGYNITMVTRGHGYWDSEERIFPKVTNIKCNRNEGLNTCEGFQKLILDDDLRFDAVVDLTARYSKQVTEAVALTKDITDLYILVSSDSIYDVSEPTEHGKKIKETQGFRPKDPELMIEYKKVSPQGDLQMICEEELKTEAKKAELPYVILRVPDMVGPRDSSHRWWMYQLWLKVQDEFPLEPIRYPEFMENYQISLVYSKDVADVIRRLVKRDVVVNNEIFNLGWNETFTLREIFTAICNELGLPGPKIEIMGPHDRRGLTFRYPSSRRGPLDVTKAIEKLHWKPSSWKEVVRKTVAFYEGAMTSETFHDQMNEIIQVVEHSALRESNKTKLYEVLENLYGIKLNHFKYAHDEL